jgi:hypothetical protein
MGRLLLELQEEYPDAKQQKGRKSEGYMALLQHLLGRNQYTHGWVKDWVAASYGVDGLPSEWFTEESVSIGYPEIDYDDGELPTNLFNTVLKKNDARWKQSRLQVRFCVCRGVLVHREAQHNVTTTECQLY